MMTSGQVNLLAMVCFLGGAFVYSHGGWAKVIAAAIVILIAYLLIDRSERS
jgi:hypothetical protein